MNSNTAAQNITDDSFAATFAPTAVDRLDATATRDGARTLVEWTTAREAQNLGFRIYRDGKQISRGRPRARGPEYRPPARRRASSPAAGPPRRTG
ncbi:MAG: hypothetical protein AABO58_14545 [Acidobacteriota bacterium]